MSDSHLITTICTTFRITRLINDRLYSSIGDLTIELEFEDSPVNELHRDRLTIMTYWLKNILDESVAFNVHNTLNTEIFGQIANNIMFCPGEPQDHLILMLVTAKLNAIGMGMVSIVSSSLAMDTGEGLGNTLVGDPRDMLPDGEDWMGKVRYWNEPWWHRPDGGMMDIPVNEDDDPTVKPDILINIDDVVSKITLTLEGDADEDVEPAEIIRPNFKPKIISKDADD